VVYLPPYSPDFNPSSRCSPRSRTELRRQRAPRHHRTGECIRRVASTGSRSTMRYITSSTQATRNKETESALDEAIFRTYRHVYLLGKDNNLRPDRSWPDHVQFRRKHRRVDPPGTPKMRRNYRRISPAKLIKYWPPAFDPSGRQKRCEMRSTHRPAFRMWAERDWRVFA